MKQINTILKLVHKELVNAELFNFGLCRVVNDMKYNKQLTNEECYMFDNYLRCHRPYNNNIDQHWGYYWKCGYKTYRLKWLEKHIKLTS